MYYIKVYCRREGKRWQYIKTFEDKETANRVAKELIETGPVTFVDGPTETPFKELHKKAR